MIAPRGQTEAQGRFGVARDCLDMAFRPTPLRNRPVVRFLTLHHIADEANTKGSLCAMENPEYPMTYLPEPRKHAEIPSIWAWPEILGFIEGSKRGSTTGKEESSTLWIRLLHLSPESPGISRSSIKGYWVTAFASLRWS